MLSSRDVMPSLVVFKFRINEITEKFVIICMSIFSGDYKSSLRNLKHTRRRKTPITR